MQIASKIRYESGPLAGQTGYQIHDEDTGALVSLHEADGEQVDPGNCEWTNVQRIGPVYDDPTKGPSLTELID